MKLILKSRCHLNGVGGSEVSEGKCIKTYRSLSFKNTLSHPGDILTFFRLSSLRPGSSVLVKCVYLINSLVPPSWASLSCCICPYQYDFPPTWKFPPITEAGSTLSTLLTFLLGEPVHAAYQSINEPIVSWALHFTVLLSRYANEPMESLK